MNDALAVRVIQGLGGVIDYPDHIPERQQGIRFAKRLQGPRPRDEFNHQVTELIVNIGIK